MQVSTLCGKVSCLIRIGIGNVYNWWAGSGKIKFMAKQSILNY